MVCMPITNNELIPALLTGVVRLTSKGPTDPKLVLNGFVFCNDIAILGVSTIVL